MFVSFCIADPCMTMFYIPEGNPRPPFDDLINRIASLRDNYDDSQSSPVIVSVDIPSGWHVEDGDISGKGLKPDMLVMFFR